MLSSFYSLARIRWSANEIKTYYDWTKTSAVWFPSYCPIQSWNTRNKANEKRAKKNYENQVPWYEKYTITIVMYILIFIYDKDDEDALSASILGFNSEELRQIREEQLRAAAADAQLAPQYV